MVQPLHRATFDMKSAVLVDKTTADGELPARRHLGLSGCGYSLIDSNVVGAIHQGDRPTPRCQIAHKITVTIGTNEVSLAGNNSATNAAFNAADGFHTYRLEIGHRVATLFIDNVSFAVSEFSDPPHHPDEYANRVTFGDGGGCGTSSAEILGVRFQNLMTALAVQPFGSTDVQISWASLDNYKYQVQWRADLTAGGWIDLNGPIQGNGAVSRVVDTLGDAQRFYRLIVLHD